MGGRDGLTTDSSEADLKGRAQSTRALGRKDVVAGTSSGSNQNKGDIDQSQTQ